MYHRLLQISTSAESFQQNLIGKYKENQRGTNSAELLSNACRADSPAIGALIIAVR